MFYKRERKKPIVVESTSTRRRYWSPFLDFYCIDIMEKLLQDIDKLVYDVKNDSNRTKIIDLWVSLELSKIYWEAKQEYIRAKNEYDRDCYEDGELEDVPRATRGH